MSIIKKLGAILGVVILSLASSFIMPKETSIFVLRIALIIGALNLSSLHFILYYDELQSKVHNMLNDGYEKRMKKIYKPLLTMLLSYATAHIAFKLENSAYTVILLISALYGVFNSLEQISYILTQKKSEGNNIDV